MNVSGMAVIKCYKSIIFFISIYLFYIDFSTASSTVCSASENEKWNWKKEKCVKCPKCPPGHFRNLTEPYIRRTGEHGPERCIKCRPCPEGTYSKNGDGDCMRCIINCTDFYRETDEQCSSWHDAKCGSCLSGFEDMFKNTGFPCAPKRSLRLLDTPKQRNKENELTNTKSDDKTQAEGSISRESDEKTNLPTDVILKSAEGKTSPESPVVTVVILSACGVVSAAGFITVITIYRRRSHTITGLHNSSQDLSNDNDIEMDILTLREDTVETVEETIPKTSYMKVPQSEPEPVHQRPLQPRPELSQVLSSNTCDGFMYIGLPDSPRHVLRFKKYEDICTCRTDGRCKCRQYKFPSTVNIEKSDKYVLEVAANICHDPLPLFSKLGLGDPVIYQENDTRDRDPQKISQKELVINLMNKWIEVKPTPSTLQQLSTALCEAHFHIINDKLIDLCMNSESQGNVR